MGERSKNGVKMEKNWRKDWCIKTEKYRTDLNVIYQNVEKIHKFSRAYYFKDHGINHSYQCTQGSGTVNKA